ncbi:MAG TPA: efflux RND transporter periplasmic adaptor subunit [Geminicoccaceae bacterium]|nr:efflux RND transporter periplasmic adaptor subunit [Geminicoccaceae bacterium]
MAKHVTKAVALGALALAVGGGAFWYLHLDRRAEQVPVAAAQEGPPLVAVEATEVEVGEVVDAMTVTGTLRSDESADISPEIEGRVTGVHFTEGETVEQGDLLFTLDDAVYRAALATAEANLELSRRNRERAVELVERKAGTLRARDEAEAQLAINHAEVDLARARLEKTRITAPFAGVVGLREVSVGNYVSPGQDLVNLEDIDPIKVDFPVPERALSALEVGQSIEVTVDAWPGRTFEGEVYAIDPRIDAQGRSIAIRATIDNHDRLLRPGLFAAVRLITARRTQALLVPEQAIFAQQGRPYVYKVVDGVARLTGVRLGGRSVGEAEIVEGLAAGDVVVTAGQLKLFDGARVRLVDPDEPAPAAGKVS